MKKSFWIALALLVVGGAQVAHADTFTYKYTDPLDGFSWTTEAIPAVTMETTILGTDLTATSTSGSFTGCMITSVVLDFFGEGTTITNIGNSPKPTCMSLGAQFGNGDGFTLTDYSTVGKHTAANGDTLVVTAAPEPSSLALIPLGLGALLVMRRRMGHIRPTI